MSPPLATWNTKRPARPGVGVGVGAIGLGVSAGSTAGVGVGGTGVGVLVAASAGLGVAVKVEVGVGDCCALVGRGMMVGSGGTSWPHAVSRNIRANVHKKILTTLAPLTHHPLLIAQSIDGV
jgi:hypothetical protein